MTVEPNADPASPNVPAFDERTGEPRRPRLISVVTALCWLAVALVAASLVSAYWRAVFDYSSAAWLMGLDDSEPGSLSKVLLAVAATAVGLAVAVPLAITGFYAWAGYRWSRVAAVIAAVLSFAALALNALAWAVPVLAVGAAILTWTPPATGFFTAWAGLRHAEPPLAEAVTRVEYGPLRRYR